MKKITAVLLISITFLYFCMKKQVPKDYVIRYSAPGFMLYNEIRENIGKHFENDNPDIKTVYEPVSGQGYFEKIIIQIASQTKPDVSE